MSAWLEILIIFLLILTNGVLAMAELAILSARKARLEQLAQEGDERAHAALKLATAPGYFLAAVQVGITLVGILSGAFAGATVAEELEVWLGKMLGLQAYLGALSVGVVVVFITFFSLVLGELAPKQVALNDPEGIAARLARPMQALTRLAGPLVRLLNASAGLVLKLMGIHPSQEPGVSAEEIKILMGQGTDEGVFEPMEEEIVEQVFRLADLKAENLLTPRTEIDWLDLDDPPVLLRQQIVESIHTYLPVARGSLDELAGFIRGKDLLAQSLRGESFDLLAVTRPPLLVPESTPALEVLERFKQTRVHIAFVLDEYGGIQGLITSTDLLEAMVGDLPELHETLDPDIVRREDGSYLLDGLLAIDLFKQLFDLKQLPGEDERRFVMAQLGRVPQPGNHFHFESLRIEVMDMDGNRVDKLLVIDGLSKPASSDRANRLNP
jgi:putative hemolysin